VYIVGGLVLCIVLVLVSGARTDRRRRKALTIGSMWTAADTTFSAPLVIVQSIKDGRVYFEYNVDGYVTHHSMRVGNFIYHYKPLGRIN